jgi:hypothetical protein
MPQPVAVSQHHCVGRAGSVVSLRKPSPHYRLYAERVERSVSNIQRLDLLRLARPRNGCAVVRPQTELLKSPALLAVREVHGGRAVDVARDSGYTRRHVPDPRQLLRFRIGQRFDEHSVHNAENGRVGADAERECHQGDRGEHRGPSQSPEDVS